MRYLESLLSGFLDRIIYVIPALIIAMTVHELAHAFISYKLGDPTAKQEGRLTLNPLKHIDPVGFILICLFGFGWAKPVPVRLQWYDRPKLAFALTAAAGPISNLLLAVVGALIFGVIAGVTYGADIPADNVVIEYLLMFFGYFINVNVGMAVFNLIPIPPLDGSRIVMAFLPNKIYSKVLFYERYSMIGLFILIATGLLDTPINWLVETALIPFEYIFEFVSFNIMSLF